MKNTLSWVGLAAMALLFLVGGALVLQDVIADLGLWLLLAIIATGVCGTGWLLTAIRVDQLEDELARLRAAEELRQLQERDRR